VWDVTGGDLQGDGNPAIDATEAFESVEWMVRRDFASLHDDNQQLRQENRNADMGEEMRQELIACGCCSPLFGVQDLKQSLAANAMLAGIQ
jgi:hypothetical protein